MDTSLSGEVEAQEHLLPSAQCFDSFSEESVGGLEIRIEPEEPQGKGSRQAFESIEAIYHICFAKRCISLSVVAL